MVLTTPGLSDIAACHTTFVAVYKERTNLLVEIKHFQQGIRKKSAKS
jgi:hypothetical protein